MTEPEGGKMGEAAQQQRLLARKLAEITGELSGQIRRTGEKKGTTRAGGEFSYPVLNESDVLGPCARALAAHGIGFLPEVLSVDHREAIFDTKSKHLCDVLVRFTFLDAESGESFVGAMPGSALETGDGTGIAKACGDATKSFLRKTFLLSTGNDAQAPRPATRPAQAPPAAPTNTPVVISDPMRKRMFAIAREYGVSNDQLADHLIKVHGVSMSRDLPKTRYDAVILWLQTRNKAQ